MSILTNPRQEGDLLSTKEEMLLTSSLQEQIGWPLCFAKCKNDTFTVNDKGVTGRYNSILSLSAVFVLSDFLFHSRAQLGSMEASRTGVETRANRVQDDIV